MSERWADSNWALLALGSNGYVQVSGTTPRSFSRRLAVGDVVRVTVDLRLFIGMKRAAGGLGTEKVRNKSYTVANVHQ